MRRRKVGMDNDRESRFLEALTLPVYVRIREIGFDGRP